MVGITPPVPGYDSPANGSLQTPRGQNRDRGPQQLTLHVGIVRLFIGGHCIDLADNVHPTDYFPKNRKALSIRIPGAAEVQRRIVTNADKEPACSSRTEVRARQ